MKTLIAVLVGMLVVPSLMAETAQSLAGNWKGTLVYPHGPTLDAWAAFSEASDDSWTGTFAVPGEGATEAGVRNISVVGRQVAFEVAMPHGRLLFRGELSEDGERLQGTGIDPRRSSTISLERVRSEPRASAAKPGDTDRTLFTALEKEWRESIEKRDPKALGALLSPEFEALAATEGRGFESTPRAAVLEAAKGGTARFPCSDGWIDVRRFDDVAIVSTLCPAGTFTDIWRLDRRKWKVLARCSGAAGEPRSEGKP
ncbi:MAG: nuclear transport factor 2 family protein [Thermoanaerobaculia bacterium]